MANSSSTSSPRSNSSSGNSRPSRSSRLGSRDRFQMVFRRFSARSPGLSIRSRCFSTICNGSTRRLLKLLEHLITHPDVRHVLLIGAFRDNEVGPSHPLMRTLAAVRGTGARVQDIVLAPLGLTIWAGSSADTCIVSRSRAPDAAGTRRRPAIRFSRSSSSALAEEGLFAFDAAQPTGSGTWHASAPKATPTTWWI
jgi:hypothetical protein